MIGCDGNELRPVIDHDAKPDRAWVVRYELRRLVQTPRAFSNWPQLLAGLAREKVGQGPGRADLPHPQRPDDHDPQRPRRPGAPRTRSSPTTPTTSAGSSPTSSIDRCTRSTSAPTSARSRPLFGKVHPTATVDCFEPSPDTVRVPAPQHRGQRPGRPDPRRTRRRWPARPASPSSTSRARVGAQPPGLRRARGRRRAGRDRHLRRGRGRRPRPGRGHQDGLRGRRVRPRLQVDSPPDWSTVQRLVLEYHDVPGESWEELRAWFAGVGLHVLRERAGPDRRHRVALRARRCATPRAAAPGRASSKALYEARRVAQTPRAFTNWPSPPLRPRAREASARARHPAPSRRARASGSPRPTCPAPASPRTSSTPRTATGSSGSSAPQGPADPRARRRRPRRHLRLPPGRGAPHGHDHLLRAVRRARPRYLQRNIDQNGLGDRISVVEAALQPARPAPPSSTTTVAPACTAAWRRTTRSTTRTPPARGGPHARLRRRHRRRAGPVDLVKLDCEGGEYQMAYRSVAGELGHRAAGRARVPRHPR